jgi:hypothetical protein
MWHGEAGFLAFGRENLAPRRHVGMNHNRECQTPILIRPESKTVPSEARSPIFETVLVTSCHRVM